MILKSNFKHYYIEKIIVARITNIKYFNKFFIFNNLI